MIRGNRLVWTCACALAACTAPPAAPPVARAIPVGGTSPLVAAFQAAAANHGVPAELLAALAHVETRMRLVASAGHDGPARAGLYALTSDELARGAQLAGVTPEAARTEVSASIAAAAALLREAAPGAVTVDDFLGALRPELADSARAALIRGVDARGVVIAAHPELAPRTGVTSQALGYSGAEWIPASTSNYQRANRGVGDIDHVVIHTTQGSYAGTVSWFKNPQAQVSAHYVVRSSDGHIAQMVEEKDVAWHDRCFNTRTVGIEHEGFVDDPEQWYTEALYIESAKLTSYLCDTYGIPKEYGSIVGHDTAPDCSDHTDPGSGWDWAHFIALVQTNGAGSFLADNVVVEAPAEMRSGERATVVVTVANAGRSAWELDITRLGTAEPQDRESAFFVDGDWLGPNRATAIDARVEPGATGTFTFDIVAPDVTEATSFNEAFQLVEEGITWFGPTANVEIRVLPEEGGCNATSGSSALPLLALAGLALRRRRRRP